MIVSPGYSYNDLLLVPKYSEVFSRSDVDLSTDLGKGIKLDIPVISANMVAVTGVKLARTMARLGGMAILHRFDSTDTRINTFLSAVQPDQKTNYADYIGVSVGTTQEEYKVVDRFLKLPELKIICIDVAHGHHDLTLKMIDYISKNAPQVLLIAGNVATSTAAYDLASAGADVIKVNVGSGCFAAGTRVLMSNGTYKNIESVKVGDRVINMNGKPVKVLRSFSTGIKKVISVKNTLAHKKTIVTPDHLYYAGNLESVSFPIRGSYVKILNKQTRRKDNKIDWWPISKAKSNDAKKMNLATLLPSKINFEISSDFKEAVHTHDNFNKIIDTVHLTPSYDLGYIFGTFLGDGCSHVSTYKKSTRGSVEWYFGLHEQLIVSKLTKCIKDIFNKDVVVEATNNLYKIHFYFKPFADYLTQFGKRQEKHLPNHLLVDNKEYLQGIVDGLVDSDGHTEKRTIGDNGLVKTSGRDRLCNTSLQIMELFGICKYILTGVMPNSSTRVKSVGGLIGTNIDNIHQGYCSESLRTGSGRIMQNLSLQVAKIVSYTDEGNECEVYDLEVDDDTHSFIADNAIVHNSACTTRIQTGNGVPAVTALDDVYSLIKNVEKNDLKGYSFKIIADGGIQTSGHLTIAMCFSHAVMLGNLLAGTDEAPNDKIEFGGKIYKKYAGSSTHKTKNVEGVAGLVPYRGPLANVIDDLMQGLRSGCSYQGANNLEELRKDPRFVSITSAGYNESKPHSMVL